MYEQTDASLVGRILAGEKDLFCTLVRKYQNRVCGVAVGILADFHLALDAGQEAFLCAYCSLPKLKDPRRFGAWLCGIARNTALEIRRNRQRQQNLAQEAAEYAGPGSPAPSSLQLAGENEERAIVERALRNVNEKDREALTLRLTLPLYCASASTSRRRGSVRP
jgi:RNA polymerase sigma factor (sigma-70 family)